MIWGIRDNDHALVGTSFHVQEAKVGNEDLENWLATQVYPRIHFIFKETDFESKHFVVLFIPAAHSVETTWKKSLIVEVDPIRKAF